MVCVWVGKEFPDGRKNEKELKFIRVGDSQNSGWAQGKTDIEQGSLVHFYTQGTRSEIGVLQVFCQLDKACILGGGRVRQIISPCVESRGKQVILLRKTWNSFCLNSFFLRIISWFCKSVRLFLLCKWVPLYEFLDSTSQGYLMLFFSLTSFSIPVSGSIHAVATGIILCCFMT